MKGEPLEIILTPRESDVLWALMEDAASNEMIARRLFVSLDTVKSHMKSILRKSGKKDRTALVLAVERRQIVLGEWQETRGCQPGDFTKLNATQPGGLRGPRLGRRYEALAR